MGIKLKSLLESNPHLQKPKADEPEKTGEMPTSYEIVWLEENDEGIIEEKDKTFKSKESFEEFCCELEENPNFIQINKKVEPSKVESVDQPSTDYKEIKESLILEGDGTDYFYDYELKAVEGDTMHSHAYNAAEDVDWEKIDTHKRKIKREEKFIDIANGVAIWWNRYTDTYHFSATGMRENKTTNRNTHILKENYKRFFGGLGPGFKNRDTQNYLSENSSTAIDTINHNGQNLTLHKIGDNPMKIQFHLEDENGEPYLHLSTILPDNLLIDAVWVKSGDIEEEIADTLDILSKTDRTTKSGYNTYILYDIIG